MASMWGLGPVCGAHSAWRGVCDCVCACVRVWVEVGGEDGADEWVGWRVGEGDVGGGV